MNEGVDPRTLEMVVVDADASAFSDAASSFGGLEQMLPFRGGLTPEELAARQQRRLEQQRRQTKINAAGARAKTQMAERGALDQERDFNLLEYGGLAEYGHIIGGVAHWGSVGYGRVYAE